MRDVLQKVSMWAGLVDWYMFLCMVLTVQNPEIIHRLLTVLGRAMSRILIRDHIVHYTVAEGRCSTEIDVSVYSDSLLLPGDWLNDWGRQCNQYDQGVLNSLVWSRSRLLSMMMTDWAVVTRVVYSFKSAAAWRLRWQVAAVRERHRYWQLE